MMSTVKTRAANHYELLGLSPAASREEIDDAFARAMRLPHPMAELAQIGLAFDTLRSPAKRRAYDEALGIRPEPQPLFPPPMSFRVSARLAALASPGPVEPARSSDPLHRPAVPLETRTERPVERASEPKPAPSAERRPTLPDHDAIAEFLSRGPRPTASERERAGGLDWKYPAFAVGSVVAIVAAIGAWAGAHVQDADGAKPAGAALTVPVPAARPPVATAEPPAATSEPDLAASEQAPLIAPPLPSRARHATRRTPPTESRLADIGQSLAATPADAAPADAAAQPAADPQAPASAPAAPAASASLPLPNAVVARTIERIGYACGSVASTAAVEGGAFKVTCTSGQSYQAKPVHGRFHFRRW